MRSFLRWSAPISALLMAALAADCGGIIESTGGSDASTESPSSGGGGSGGSSGGSSSGSSSDSACPGSGGCPSGFACCGGIGCYANDGSPCPPDCPACVSDRNVKRDIVPVDPQAILDGLVRVPVSTWSYKSDDPSIRHMGPMAQDLYGEFGLGNTDRAYSPIDAHGLAFAAIQALYERVQQQEARIRQLERENGTGDPPPSCQTETFKGTRQ